MISHYQDYYWKMGKPYGKSQIEPLADLYSYKIISDPYHKRFSIEKYQGRNLQKVVYDSIFLDFRHLNPLNQIGWQREQIYEDEKRMTCLLRNQDDRSVLLETHYFEQQRCRCCTLQSTHGIFLSVHCMYYRALQDPFDGVVLFDREKHPVLVKTYTVDLNTGEFTTMLKEEWDMQNPPAQIQGSLWQPSFA